MLLQAKKYLTSEELNDLVKPTVEFILNLQFPSGNFPSSLGNSADKLVHWCHGAPGVVHLLLLAYETFKEEKYLEASKKCSDLIWERGLLKKGYGLCHGVAGNGYAHLRVFQVTKDVKYLYRAVKFAEWCFEYGKHGCRTPDRPLSLFEGFAGTIYYLLDLLDPLYSAFPAFQLV
ncbi:LanC-like protein 2, partial [Stegodyphus mimosarum]